MQEGIGEAEVILDSQSLQGSTLLEHKAKSLDVLPFKYLNIVVAFPYSSEWLFQTLKKCLWIPFLDQTW